MPGVAEADGSGDMMGDARNAKLRPHDLNLKLGIWLVSSPFTLGCLSEFIPNARLLRVMKERGLPLGGVSIYFIIIQPIVIGTWCTICLIAELEMVIIIPGSLDEFVAISQFLVDARCKGRPFWRALWTGDAMEGGMTDPASGPGAPIGDMIRQAARGVTLPRALAGCAVGLWFIYTQICLGTSGQTANSDHLIDALVVTLAIIAFAEVARPLRFINIAFGLWLIAAQSLLTGNATPFADWAGMAGGVLLIALSIPRGRIANSCAGCDRVMLWPM